MSPEFLLVCVVLGVSTAVGVYMAGRHNHQQQGKALPYEPIDDEGDVMNHPSDVYHKDVKPLQEDTNAELVEKLRKAAKELSARMPEGITSDDILEVCEIPTSVDRRIMGAVFNKIEWEHVGWVPTRRREAHGRPIRRWRRKIA